MEIAYMTIKEWLDNPRPSYQDGIELMIEHQCSRSYIQLMNLGYNVTNLKIMRSELQKILDKQESAAVKQGDYTNENFVVKELERVMKAEFKRLNSIFMTGLTGNQNESVRCKNAKEIIEGFEFVIAPIQEQLRYFEENGKLPADHFLSKPSVKGWVDIKQKILNLRSLISKNKSRDDRSADLAKWYSQLDQLQKELDAIQQ